MSDFTSFKVFFRDQFVDFKDATLSVSNTGFMYGLGVFTGIRAHWNEDKKQLYLFRPSDHYKRFRNSCKLCNYTNFTENYDYEKFLGVLIELMKVNDMKSDAYIRVSSFTDGLEIGPKFSPKTDSLVIFTRPIGDYVPSSGMKCMVSSWRRVDDTAIPARAKVHGAYVNTAFAKDEALRNGYDEAIVLDSLGHAVEGSAENLFIVREGVIITPTVTDNILEGITRKTSIQIAKDLGYEVLERSIDRTELYFADEVFLTGTAAKVSPVTLIDGITIGNGKPGEISTKIQEVYFDAVKGKREEYMDWLVGVY